MTIVPISFDTYHRLYMEDYLHSPFARRGFDTWLHVTYKCEMHPGTPDFPTHFHFENDADAVMFKLVIE